MLKHQEFTRYVVPEVRCIAPPTCGPCLGTRNAEEGTKPSVPAHTTLKGKWAHAKGRRGQQEPTAVFRSFLSGRHVTSLCGHRASSTCTPFPRHFSKLPRPPRRLAGRHLQLRSHPPASNCPFFAQCPRPRRLRSPLRLRLSTRRGRARSAGCCPRARRCPTRTISTTHSPSTSLTPPPPGARRLLPPPCRVPFRSRSRSRATAAASPASCSAPLPRLLPAARPPRHPPPRTPLPPPPRCPCPPRRRALRSPLRLLLSTAPPAGSGPRRQASRLREVRQGGTHRGGNGHPGRPAPGGVPCLRRALLHRAPDVCSASWAPCRRAASVTPASARR